MTSETIAESRKKGNRITATFSLRPAQIEKLRRLAEEEDKPVSFLVREALQDYMTKKGVTP